MLVHCLVWFFVCVLASLCPSSWWGTIIHTICSATPNLPFVLLEFPTWPEEILKLSLHIHHLHECCTWTPFSFQKRDQNSVNWHFTRVKHLKKYIFSYSQNSFWSLFKVTQSLCICLPNDSEPICQFFQLWSALNSRFSVCQCAAPLGYCKSPCMTYWSLRAG